MLDIKALCVSAKQASYNLGGMAEDKKNKILTAIASSILSNKDYILAENKKDINNLIGKDNTFLDRLTLT